VNSLADDRLTIPPEIRARLEQVPWRAVLAVPLMQQDEVIGVLSVGDSAGRVFTEEEIHLAQAFADQAATALENARLFQETQHAYRDLTQTQAQLIQAQKMEAVGRLAGGVAHDFNNLLTVIIGRTQLLLLRLPSENQARRDAELIRSTARRAAELTQQLLAFSRRQILQPRLLNLNTLVANLSTMLRRLIGEDIELVTAISPSPGWVNADPGQIEQVLMNLTINARDAMPQGGQLSIETANVLLDRPASEELPDLLPGRYVRLSVRDTGVGMDAETRSHLFEPFFTTKEPGRGTGLGLATVYGIVQQSGGHITVDSQPGQGATFTIYLPQIEQAVESLESATSDVRPTCGQETILLAEDEAEVRELAAEILQQAGYTVLQAEHGPAALRVSLRHEAPIQLLLTDVVMPGMNGRDLANRLRQVRPGLQILYMSGYTDEVLGRHGIVDPNIAFLQKPFTADVLLQAVRGALETPPAG
jgi:signal transduction histidine kinase/CheY-like chemotaxis protein